LNKIEFDLLKDKTHVISYVFVQILIKIEFVLLKEKTHCNE